MCYIIRVVAVSGRQEDRHYPSHRQLYLQVSLYLISRDTTKSLSQRSEEESCFLRVVESPSDVLKTRRTLGRDILRVVAVSGRQEDRHHPSHRQLYLQVSLYLIK